MCNVCKNNMVINCRNVLSLYKFEITFQRCDVLYINVHVPFKRTCNKIIALDKYGKDGIFNVVSALFSLFVLFVTFQSDINFVCIFKYS